MNEKEKLIEMLKLEVVLPAKSKVIYRKEQKSKKIYLLCSNYRNRRDDEFSIHEWREMFESAGLNLENCLRAIIKKEIGERFDIKLSRFSGYLGVASDTNYLLVFPKK